jgi:hypothetical protein
MTSLTTILSYDVGRAINVRVSAQNAKGWTTTTLSTGSILTQTAPVQAPTISSAVSKTSTEITINFGLVSGNANTGYAPISGYFISWYEAAQAKNLTVTSSPADISGLTQGTTYQIKV